MKAYRFLTKVSDSGAIQIPFELALFDQEVEVIILTKPTPAKKKPELGNLFKNGQDSFQTAIQMRPDLSIYLISIDNGQRVIRHKCDFRSRAEKGSTF